MRQRIKDLEEQDDAVEETKMNKGLLLSQLNDKITNKDILKQQKQKEIE